jgi:hypothetical protein
MDRRRNINFGDLEEEVNKLKRQYLTNPSITVEHENNKYLRIAKIKNLNPKNTSIIHFMKENKKTIENFLGQMQIEFGAYKVTASLRTKFRRKRNDELYNPEKGFTLNANEIQNRDMIKNGNILGEWTKRWVASQDEHQERDSGKCNRGNTRYRFEY